MTEDPKNPEGPARPENWYARASVPPPAPPAPVEDLGWDERANDGGRWWMPILIGVIALLLLGVLGFGLWLIAAADDEEPGPGTPSATAPAPSRAPSTVASTVGEPTTAPAPVSVPYLVGLPLDEARANLEELGLTYRLRYQESGADPETVLATDPGGGSEVAPGSRVLLVVARSPKPDPPPTEVPTGPGATGGN